MRGAGAYREGEIELGQQEILEKPVDQILKDVDDWSEYHPHYRGEEGGEVACVFEQQCVRAGVLRGTVWVDRSVENVVSLINQAKE